MTGGSGFIGQHLCRMLTDQGWEVSAERTWGNVPPADTIFHLATLFMADHKLEDIKPLIDSNITFGAQVLEMAAAGWCRRFINVETVWQHPRPRCLYAATKAAFHDVLEYYGAYKGINFSVVTLGDTYGPNDNRPKLVNALINAANKREHIVLLPRDHKISLTHVDDVCRALIAGKPGWACADPVTLQEVVDTVEQVTERNIDAGWNEREYRPGETTEPYMGARQEGWVPQVSLEDGIRSLL